jgi:lipoprotein
MKTIARLGLLALLLSIVWAACTHEPDVPPRPAPKPDTTAVDSALLGKWYLAGLGRVGDTTVTPIDSVSYALEIWREGFLYGHYVNGSYTWRGDSIHIKLNVEDKQRMPDRIRTYREALLSVESYRVDNEHQMRLFYDRGQRYLLFRDQPTTPSKQAIVPQALLTTWILHGRVYFKDGNKALLRNTETGRLRFYADATWVFQLSTGQLTGSFRTDGQSMHFTITPPSLKTSPNEAYYLRQALERVTSYKIYDNELQLYVGGEEAYLTFKKAKIGTSRINEHLCRPWKLVGFGHTAGSSLQELTGADRLSNKAFLVEFRDNGMLYALSSTNEFDGEYSVDGQSLRMNVGGGTMVNETKEGHAYVQALHAAERFELQKDGQLKLFYNQGRDYLLFRDGLSLVSSTPPAELLGKWTLAQIITFSQPPVVFEPGEHTITFHKSGYIDVEGYKLFGSIPEDKLPYGYHPWGQKNTLFIGWAYFTYNLEGETLTMSNGVDIDGPVYVFKRLRK